MNGSIRRLAAIAGGAILFLAAAGPAWADAVYPSDAEGNWRFGPDLCDGTPWSQTYHLGYVLNDPDVDGFNTPKSLIPGETITVELAPAIIGSLHGSVVVEGATTFTSDVASEAAFQGRLLDATSTFTLSVIPGSRTIGSGVVDGDDWEVVPIGIAAVEATITGSESGIQRFLAPAQQFVSCQRPPVTAGVPTGGSTADPTPTPTGEVLALPDTDVGPTTGSSGSSWVAVAGAGLLAWTTLLAALLALRRRQPGSV